MVKKIRTKTKAKEKAKEKPFKAVFTGENVVSNASKAMQLYESSRFGELVQGKIHYSLIETLYLLDRGKLEVLLGKKKLGRDVLMAIAREREANFFTRYCVYSDLRNRGYIVKTALKFGADFRVYERGIKPGEEHAKWIVYPVPEASSLTWYEFAAKNRVAHSTRKHLLIAIVDDEGDVTYYEIRWLKP